MWRSVCGRTLRVPEVTVAQNLLDHFGLAPFEEGDEFHF
jgi:hypothetical protein